MRETFRSGLTLFGLVIRSAPLLAAAEFSAAIIIAVAVPLQTYGLGLVVDGIAAGDGVLRGMVVLAGAIIAYFGCRILSSAVQSAMEDRVEGSLNRELLAITTGIPGLEHHERPDVADRLAVIREESRYLKYGATTLASALAVAAGSVTVLALLVVVHPLFILLPLLGTVRVLCAGRAGRLRLRAMEATADRHRMIDMLTEIAKSPRHGLEVRTFRLGDFITERLALLHSQRDEPRWAAAKRAAGIDVIGRIVSALGYGGAIGFVVWLSTQGTVGPSEIVMVVLLVPQVDRAAAELSNSSNELTWALGTVANFRWLRDYARSHAPTGELSPAPARLETGIRFSDVTFSYPGAQRASLESVDLFLPAGSTVAFVGDNGAGKSTLVKLLARFYDPSRGTIEVDGQDLRQIDPESWRRAMSAGFQDFVKFEFETKEAIGIGDLPRLDDRAAIEHAVVRADAEGVVEHLPSGLDTQIGSRFSGGVELSGGQWQRVALARSFMRNDPVLLLLDEPTAAIDPESESALFERFAAASATTAANTGGITVLVSHRFSTVRMADLIVVVEDGGIAEAGSHEELMAANGHYAEMFELQARSYR
ncbi:ABC transporter ATP-binding protein [Glycomyces luteolus]|uniref:ABC transporter ATP-binding protein n=1 Tax=Glycomyces luteolus TaxID=2670330 RepID=A0A9X3PJS5_9ACTN|nr:ABC transporter ATP-binding protein [Glycomyces luteolus]MDA1359855.1 ABC transporter ATP-binding protein [Glycomyces luteolus]